MWNGEGKGIRKGFVFGSAAAARMGGGSGRGGGLDSGPLLVLREIYDHLQLLHLQTAPLVELDVVLRKIERGFESWALLESLHPVSLGVVKQSIGAFHKETDF